MSQTNDVVSQDEPCMHCGACCASFRVSFYWAEAESCALPEHAVEQLTSVYACMKGTNSATPRCLALQGKVGEQVACSLYAHRPSPCREVQVGDEKCETARARHGLPPLAGFQ